MVVINAHPMFAPLRITKNYLYSIGGGSLLLALGLGYVLISQNTPLFDETTPSSTAVAVVKEDALPPSPPRTEIKKQFFGYSTTGRDIYGYEIGSGEEVVLLFGAIHGNEKSTTDLLNTFVEEIQANPERVSQSKKIVVIPLLNPDGYYERSDNLNINSVNLNRNFGTKEWSPYAQGVSAGSEPFSEKESVVIQEVVETYQPDMMIAFHSQGALVSPEEDLASVALARWYAGKTGYAYYDEWSYLGTATLWFQETLQKPAITVELPNHTQSDWGVNKDALWELISSQTRYLDFTA